MAFVDLTKQLAKEALLSAADKATTPAPAAGPESAGAMIFSQIGAMQKALKEDEELQVFLQTGAERIRVMEIFAPSWQVAVVTGIESDRSLARVVSPFAALQLICKTVKPPAGTKSSRVALIIPKPKDSSA
jgi:hypothetical protein